MKDLNNNTTGFINLVKQYLASNGNDCSPHDFASTLDLEAILKIAFYNNCDPIIYHTIHEWSEEYGLDAEVLSLYKKRILFLTINQLRADAELKDVLKEFNIANIDFMLLKGIILSSLYPNPAYRRTVDADLHMSEENIEKAARLLLARGYEYIPNDGIKHVKSYSLHGILSIELHSRLFDKFYEKNRYAIKATELESRSIRKKIHVFDMLIETLNQNYFLIYLICHHTKHFIASGINLRHLIDVSLYVNKYHEQLDWELIFTALDRFGILEFTFYIFHLCRCYLGMVDLSVLSDDIDEDVVQMLFHDIVEKNAENEGVNKSSSANKIVQDMYFYGENDSLRAIKTNYFPSVKTLAQKYMYAKKYPVLLPIAWIHRALYYIKRKAMKQQIVSPTERSKLGKERVILLKKVQIL